MPNAKQRGSRSQAVRDYLAGHPDAGPKEIIEALAGQGITVTRGLVSNIKYGSAAGARTEGERVAAKPRRKRRGRPRRNRSAAIRDYLEQHPNAAPSEVREALAQTGIRASISLVSNVKHRMASRRPRAAGAPRARRAAVTSEQLLELNRVVGSLGGLDQTRKALDVLAELR